MTATENSVGQTNTSANQHIARTIEELASLENSEQAAAGLSERFADRIARLSGSVLLISLNATMLAAWIIMNMLVFRSRPFDPSPFPLLHLIVSLEVLFISAFVLISENRQTRQADKRAKVDLQVNMIAEQEIVKLIQLVAAIHDHLGIRQHDDLELRGMQQQTDIKQLADAVDTQKRQTES